MSYDYLWYIGSIKNCIIGVADGYKGYWERITERNGLEEHRARCRDGFRACDISSFLVLLHFFRIFTTASGGPHEITAAFTWLLLDMLVFADCKCREKLFTVKYSSSFSSLVSLK